MNTLNTLRHILWVTALFLFLGNTVMKAQGPTPVPPDCVIFISNWHANQSSAAFPNYYNGCVNWTMAVNPAATVTGMTMTFQSAPTATNVGTAVPGAWVTYAGTVDTGANPIVSLMGETTTFSNGTVEIPFVRVTLTGYTGTGNINGVIYGYKTGYVGSGGGGGGSGCVGTVGTPCVVDGPTASGSPPVTPPVLTAGQDGTNLRTIKTDTAGDTEVVGNAAVGAAAGNPVTTGARDDSGNALADYAFPDQNAISLITGTDVVIVTGVSATKTYVGHLIVSADSTQTITIQQGTGTTCLTNTVVLAGPFQSLIGVALDFDSKGGLHTTVNARDLCVHFGASVTAGGYVAYGTH